MEKIKHFGTLLMAFALLINICACAEIYKAAKEQSVGTVLDL